MTKYFQDNYKSERILDADDGLRVLELMDFNHEYKAINFHNIEWKFDSVIIKGNYIKFKGNYSGFVLKGLLSSLNDIEALKLFRDALKISLPWFNNKWIIEIKTPPSSNFPGVPKVAVLFQGKEFQEVSPFTGIITPYIVAAQIASLVGAIKAAEFIFANWNGSEPISVQLINSNQTNDIEKYILDNKP